jgi:hypothetical protein
MVAKRTKILPKTKGNGAAPAHTRSEVRRKRGRDNVAAEVVKLQREVAGSIRVTLAFHHHLNLHCHRCVKVNGKGVCSTRRTQSKQEKRSRTHQGAKLGYVVCVL